jgi:hypothetical protein
MPRTVEHFPLHGDSLRSEHLVAGRFCRLFETANAVMQGKPIVFICEKDWRRDRAFSPQLARTCAPSASLSDGVSA